MNQRLTLLFAVAGGAAVGNLYWSQPLLDFIAQDLKTDTGSAGWLVTATQIGYALGVFLFVPLGDLVNRRFLVPIALLCSTVALVLCAVSPSFPVLLSALALVGLTTVSGQILVPLAGDLADDATRGRVVGTVVSGILIGILASRTVSGLIAGFAGWRAIYVVAAVFSFTLSIVLYRKIPAVPRRTGLRYPALLASVFTIIKQQRSIRWGLVLGGTSFGVFTMFWTALTFLLSSPPFSYSVTTIGLFGLVGLAGAVTAQRAGRLHDRGLGLPGMGVAWTLVLVAFGVAALGSSSVVVIVVAILVLDIAIQGQNILLQSRMFQADPGARSRINTAFVTNNFIWGAVGSGLAGFLWSHGGWTSVSVAGMALSAAALVVWVIGRRGALVTPAAEIPPTGA